MSGGALQLVTTDVDATIASTGTPPARATPAVEVSLRTLARHGAFWSMAAFGGSQVLRFAGNLILTRLLFEEAFGWMALVGALLQGLQLFSDVGIGPSIIQSKRGEDPRFLNTAWTVQILRGLVLWICACIVALPFARFYGDPVLALIVPVSGLTALISGFNSTRIFSMYRNVDLARVARVELGSQAAGLVVMCGWALVDRSIWALVAGGLGGSVARLALSHTVLPGITNRLSWDRSAVRALFHFGRWIFFSTLLTFVVGQSDRLIFGKMIPIALLGVYGVAAMIATMPATALSRMGHGVFFPIYSRVHNAGEDLREIFGRVRLPLLLIAGWTSAGLSGGGEAAVHLLYDARYAEAGWMVQLLALASWFTVLEATNGAALLARGEARWTAASNAGKLAGMIVLIPTGYHVAGFHGAVAGLVLSEVLKYAVSAFAAGRAGLRGWPQDLALSAWVLISAWLGSFCATLAESAGGSRFAVASAVLLSVSLLWTPLALRYWTTRRARTS